MASDIPAPLGIIEDSDEDFAMFSRVFSRCGEIMRWPDAEAALEAFRNGTPDLRGLRAVVVDLNLPGMDGAELIEAARALPGGDVPLFCVLSSSGRPSDRRRAKEAGADGYLVKPNDIAGLRALPTQMAEIEASAQR